MKALTSTAEVTGKPDSGVETDWRFVKQDSLLTIIKFASTFIRFRSISKLSLRIQLTPLKFFSKSDGYLEEMNLFKLNLFKKLIKSIKVDKV